MRTPRLAFALALGACVGTTEPVDCEADGTCPEDSICATGAHVIYLNRAGGTYAHAFDVDAEESAVDDIFGSAWGDAPEYLESYDPLDIADADWDALLSCVQGYFPSLDVLVVDEDPSPDDHIEVVLTSTVPYVLDPGDPDPYLFIALDCAPGKGIAGVWTEDEVDADEVAAVCLAAVKGIGYKAGLEHTVADCEIMSTQECSEDRAFLDGDSACGFTTAQDCRCSTGDTFNNWAALEDLYGRCD